MTKPSNINKREEIQERNRNAAKWMESSSEQGRCSKTQNDKLSPNKVNNMEEEFARHVWQFESPTFRVTFGSSKKTFYLHKQVLTQRSAYFASMLGSNFNSRERQSDTLDLPPSLCVDGRFDMVVEYMYTGSYEPAANLDCAAQCIAHAQVYVLADRLMMGDLKALASTKMHTALRKACEMGNTSSLWDSPLLRLSLPSGTVLRIAKVLYADEEGKDLNEPPTNFKSGSSMSCADLDGYTTIRQIPTTAEQGYKYGRKGLDLFKPQADMAEGVTEKHYPVEVAVRDSPAENSSAKVLFMGEALLSRQNSRQALKDQGQVADDFSMEDTHVDGEVQPTMEGSYEGTGIGIPIVENHSKLKGQDPRLEMQVLFSRFVATSIDQLRQDEAFANYFKLGGDFALHVLSSVSNGKVENLSCRS